MYYMKNTTIHTCTFGRIVKISQIREMGNLHLCKNNEQGTIESEEKQ